MAGSRIFSGFQKLGSFSSQDMPRKAAIRFFLRGDVANSLGAPMNRVASDLD
jgi:hypothetical protein